MTTVMVVDDHILVRAALTVLLEATEDLTVAGVAADGDEAVRMAQAVRPEVVLMDLSLPKLDGIAATGRIMSLLPETRIVLLTSSEDRRRINQAFAVGAIDYLLKGCSADVVLDAVRRAASGLPV